MAYGLIQTIAPTSEPLSVATLKSHLRLNINTDDQLLSIYITTARSLIEDWTGRQLLPATFIQYLDSFSHYYRSWGGFYGMDTPRLWNGHSWWHRPLLLPKAPCIAVQSITYLDSNLATQTLDPTTYSVDNTRDPCRILLTTFPTVNPSVIPTIQITFTAGYSIVPVPLVHCIMLLASDFYRAREASSELTFAKLPYGFQSLLNAYKVFDMSCCYDTDRRH